MKSQNELDDFLRKKEQEFDLPFQEVYWQRAQELISKNRKTRSFLWFRIMPFAALFILGGIGSYVYLASDENMTRDLSTNQSSDQRTEETQIERSEMATPIFSPDKTKAAKSTDPLSTNNVEVASSAATPNTFSPSRSTHNKSTASVSGNQVASNDIAEKAQRAMIKKKSDPSRLNESDNLTLTIPGLKRKDISALTYYQQHQIPVFETMTPSDPTLLKFYGLYYDKASGTAARKIRDIKNSAQYPQLTIAAVGGLNIFNQIKADTDTNQYVGVNPYIGSRIGLQWNSVMAVHFQPTLIQRGGINLSIDIPNENKKHVYKHLYYVQAPVFVSFKMSKKNTVYAGAGISYRIGEGYKATVVDAVTFNSTSTYTIYKGNLFTKADYFGTLGYLYRMNRKLSFQGSINYGMKPVLTNESKLETNPVNRNVHVGVGLSYYLHQQKFTR